MLKYLKELEKGMFAFWVLKFKITYLLTLIIIIYGVISVINLPKEGDPEVSLPMLRIQTQYSGVTAAIIDDEITEEIESAIEDIEGISSIDGTSSEGSSSISVEIADGYDVDEVISEIEDAVDSTSLPTGIDDDPSIQQMDFSSTDMFSTILYASEDDFTIENLLDLAEVLEQNTSGKNGIKEVTIDTDTTYEIRVIVSKEKADNLGLTISNISSAINNNNTDSPIGTYEINGTNYSYKLSGKLKDYSEILNINIPVGDSYMKLSSLADIELYYGDEVINKFGTYGNSGYIYVKLTYAKDSGENIFDVAPEAKAAIESELEKEMYNGVNLYYTNDESQTIQDDFNNLYQSASLTIVLVFITLLFFVGFRESLIATLILPIAFLLAFIAVYYKGETLNQMTTFGFVLAFGIAIDTIIVIIEGATEKIKQGYTPRHATLISIKEYKSPLIIGTLTTIAAFLPILSLPGMMGIMLSYIPMVVFITLISTLIVSLCIAGPIFVGLSKNRKVYEVFEEDESVMSSEEKELLEYERKGKTEISHTGHSIREKILFKMAGLYEKYLNLVFKNWLTRILAVLIPIGILVITVMSLTSKLGFEIFPSSAMNRMEMTITGPENLSPSDMTEEIEYIDEKLSQTHEIEDYNMSISDNNISISMTLTDSTDRAKLDEMTNTDLQTYLTEDFTAQFSAEGFSIGSRGGMRGPTSDNPVGIYITGNNADLYNDMISISKDFQNYLETLEQVSEVNVSASSTVGQIDFKIDEEKASLLGLDKSSVYSQISNSIRGSSAGSIKGATDDNDIEIYYDKFLENVTPGDIENINISVNGGTIKAGSVITYDITKAAPSITRGDGDIQIEVTAGLTETSYTTEIQAKLMDFAKNYSFPAGISYKEGGDNAENSDLINGVIEGVFIALFLIFFVLVYQFNSYKQPIIILFSVVMSVIGVLWGLYLTGNSMSMPAGVGFISLMGIVVNDAIVMLDKINNNLERGMDYKTGIIKGCSSRLNPVLVTTITTVAGIIPVALQSPMWAGLGYTIAFGLTVGSFMTLFAIPSLYYIMEKRSYKKRIKDTINL